MEEQKEREMTQAIEDAIVELLDGGWDAESIQEYVTSAIESWKEENA